MKKTFEEPEVLVVEVNDIITTSGNNNQNQCIGGVSPYMTAPVLP